MHLLASVSVGLSALVGGYILIESFGIEELITVLMIVVIANLVEWIAHKELLHKRRRFWEILYDQHTPIHHRVYREDSMAVESRREWIFVLMPTRGVVGIAILGIPMALAVLQVFGADVCWTVLATIALYATSYEVLHLCYHLSEDHPIAGMRLVKKLKRHHARHHNLKLMQNWNFNVTLPLWDWILGTIAPKNHSTEDAPDA